MTSRSFMFYFLVLVVLAVGVYYVNANYIEPMRRPAIATVQPLTDKGFKPPTVDSNPIAATVERIRAAGAKKEVFTPRQVARNAFLWPGEKAPLMDKKDVPPPVVGTESVEEEQEPVISMILVGRNKKIAVINNEFLYEGSEFGGRKVISILKNEVVLEGETGEIRLAMKEITAPLAAKPLPEPAKKAEGKPFGLAPQAAKELGLDPSVLSGQEQEALQKLMEKISPMVNPGKK